MERLDRYFDTAFSAPDGIKKLRELILTLAMQGKLVPQDPNDPPACELMKHIEKEKKRLAKEGKIKQLKPLPDINPGELPYELPNGWRWARLAEISEIIGGVTYSKNQANDSYTAGMVELLRANNINGEINFSDTLFIPSDVVDDVQRLRYGDILVATSSGSPHLVGKAAQFLVDRECTFGAFCGVIRPYSDVVQIYLDRYCRTPLYRGQTQKEGKGIGIQNLNKEALKNLLIPIPSLPEQHRIVAKIDQLMARCDELEKLRVERERKRFAVHSAAIKQLLDAENRDCHTRAWQFLSRNFGELNTVKENVAELRKAILQLAMQGKLVPQDSYDPPTSELLKEIKAEKQRLVKEGKIKQTELLPEIKPEERPYELPKGWEWVRLYDISNKIHYGYTASANYDIQDVRLLRITDIQENRVNWESVPGCDVKKSDVSQFLLADNDILIARTGGTVGKSYLVQGLSVDAVFASYLIRVIPSSRMGARFLKYYVESPLYWKQLFAACSGTGQPNVNGASLSQLILPLPPSKEQHRIVAKIDQLMTLCEELEQKISAGTNKQAKLLNAVMAKV